MNATALYLPAAATLTAVIVTALKCFGLALKAVGAIGVPVAAAVFPPPAPEPDANSAIPVASSNVVAAAIIARRAAESGWPDVPVGLMQSGDRAADAAASQAKAGKSFNLLLIAALKEGRVYTTADLAFVAWCAEIGYREGSTSERGGA
jgi:hypothetical protein